jgi:hypothetical protein
VADLNSIISKVNKLLALSKSANINEASAAAAAANKLIDAYRLQECDLEIDIESSDPVEEDTDYLYESGKITAWKSSLANILVRHYGCACYNDCGYATGRKVSRYKLVGKRSDIGIIRYMFSYLTAEAARLSEKEAKGKGRVFVASYCMGFVRGVDEQLKKSRVEAQKDATSAAIVKIDGRASAARAELYRLHTNLRSGKATSHSQIDPRAFDMGKAKGSNLHLGASLNSGGTKALGQ